MKPLAEDWTRTISCISGILTTLGLLVGGGWSLYQYFENRSYQLQTARYETVEPLFEERLKLYVEITELAGTIATSKNEADLEKAKAQFSRMYYGPLNLVADRDVWLAISEFRRCMEDSKCTPYLAGLSYKLPALCGNSIKSGYLPPGVPTNLGATSVPGKER